MNTYIVQAGYGINTTVADVTAVVQKMYAAGTTAIKASNTNFGDPAPGKKKALFVIWATPSREMTTQTSMGTVYEDATLNLPPNSSQD